MTTITDRITGLNSGLAVKAPVKVATTANITLNGLQTIDGVTVVEGDRVLVKNQTTGSENGIYNATTSDWQRAKDFDGIGDAVQGTLIPVAQGTVSAGIIYEVTTATFTIGTTALVFSATADTTVGAYVAEIQIVADNIDDVNAVSSNIATVIAVNANEANINAVNANETNINLVAAIDSDVTTVAGIDGAVVTVASMETNIQGVVDNIVDIQNAEENADIAATAAITATAQAAKLTGTSTSSITIGTGSKVFTTQADKDFNGNNVRVYSDADPTNYMDGLASYSGTTLTVTVSAIGGSGTFTDWTIRVNGARGATGSVIDGDYGDVTVSSGGTVWTVDNSAITLAKIANASASSKLLGSGDSGSGSAYSEITLGTNLSITGTTLNAAGGGGGATQTTSAVDITLTSSSSSVQEITMTAVNKSCILPDATTMELGDNKFKLYNPSSTYSYWIKDSSGVVIGVVQAMAFADISLSNKSTSAGVWRIQYSNPTGINEIIHISDGYTASSTSASPASNNVFCSLSQTKGLCLYQSSANQPVYAKTINVDSSANITFGAEQTLFSGETCSIEGNRTAGSYGTLVRLSETKALLIYVSGASCYMAARVITISGDTVTTGSVTTSTIESGLSYYGHSVAVHSDSLVSVRTGVTNLFAISVSGTSATIGSKLTLTSSTVATTTGIVPLSATEGFIEGVTGSSQYSRKYTISGTTITLGTVVGGGAFGLPTRGLAVVDSTHVVGISLVIGSGSSNGYCFTAYSHNLTSNTYTTLPIVSTSGFFSNLVAGTTYRVECNKMTNGNFLVSVFLEDKNILFLDFEMNITATSINIIGAYNRYNPLNNQLFAQQGVNSYSSYFHRRSLCTGSNVFIWCNGNNSDSNIRATAGFLLGRTIS